GVSGEMDVIQVAQEAAKALETQSKAQHDKIVGEMLDQKLASEAVKKDIHNTDTVIGKLWALHRSKITPDMDKEAIAGEIDSFMNDKVVKELISGYHTDQPVGVGTSTKTEQRINLRAKRTTI